jgi:hypothetical protein
MTKKNEIDMKNKLPMLLVVCLTIGILLMTLLTACTPGVIKGNANGSHLNNEAEPNPAYQLRAPMVSSESNIDLYKYTRIPITPTQVEVSSVLRPSLGKANLVEAQYNGFWHIGTPKEETRPWILIDLKIPQATAALGILGREDADQLWRGYRAVLEASNDSENWELVAWLGLSDNRSNGEWSYFFFPDPKPNRYYRFSTYDWSFMSIAKLNMYAIEGKLSPVPTGPPKPLQIEGTRGVDLSPFEKMSVNSSQLEVSGYSQPWDKTKLINTNNEEFWHVQLPRQGDREWVIADSGAKIPVILLRVLPRSGLAQQMWNGYTADFEVSNDKQEWTTLATLGILAKELTGDWIYFLVGNLDPYRYYRLTIFDNNFFSMSKLELYQIRK